MLVKSNTLMFRREKKRDAEIRFTITFMGGEKCILF